MPFDELPGKRKTGSRPEKMNLFIFSGLSDV